jgi:hypothetical protein
MDDLDLLRQARDLLRTWVQQMHGMVPRDDSTNAGRLDPLIVALDVRLRRQPEYANPLAEARGVDERDCGSTIASVTWCCEKHANEDGEGSNDPVLERLYGLSGLPAEEAKAAVQREVAVLDAMGKVEIVQIVGGLPYIALGQANADAAAAELKRRGLEP